MISDNRIFRAVIGANYGDEGKGATTDFIARQFPQHYIANIKSNGTAQAGHTVLQNNNRFVFSHLGAASFNANAYTVIDNTFYVHPLIALAESDQFAAITGKSPSMVISDNCPIVLSIDVAINRALEFKRNQSGNKHGSCGLGLFEAVHRSKQLPVYLSGTAPEVSDILSYFNRRCDQLNLTDDDFINSNTLMFTTADAYYADLNMRSSVSNKYAKSADYLQKWHTPFLVRLYENGQGLLLDQNSDRFPHVTPSYTGSTVIAERLDEFVNDGIMCPIDVEIIYATRPYLTKHGAGPFPEKEKYGGPKLKQFVDLTNQPNEWQGTLELACLNIDELVTRCKADFKQIKNIVNTARMTLSISCVDQMNPEGIRVIYKNRKSQMNIKQLVTFFKKSGFDNVIVFSSEGIGKYY